MFIHRPYSTLVGIPLAIISGVLALWGSSWYLTEAAKTIFGDYAHDPDYPPYISFITNWIYWLPQITVAIVQTTIAYKLLKRYRDRKSTTWLLLLGIVLLGIIGYLFGQIMLALIWIMVARGG